MKAIMLMYDSLNRHYLPCYGGRDVKVPNFERLAKKTVTFDNCYAGSLPCMPARRELHTGRYNFLHRSWGPVEPYDDSMPEILKKNGIYTHMVSDHQHYWEDGGCTYHTRYSSWEIARGQEGDQWKGQVREPEVPDTLFSEKTKFMTSLMKKMGVTNIHRHDDINRQYLDTEDKMPQAVTFKNGLAFMETNRDDDNWFLQIETFDPHEPFFAPERFRDLYPDVDYDGPLTDWPPYAPVDQAPHEINHVRNQYKALLSMCDDYLGLVLDMMDKYDMWKDTMLIVNTDHGFLLGEHDWWGKGVMPIYNEIAHTPFFVWDPRLQVKNEHRSSLVQTIDIAPTLLDFFDVKIPDNMMGKPLKGVIADDSPVRQYGLFGFHGSHINITDGKYLYMRGPADRSNTPLYDYTLMPTHMRSMFHVNELQDIELEEPFDFTKGCQTMKIEVKKGGFVNPAQYGSKLFDLSKDPDQTIELDNDALEVTYVQAMKKIMQANDAPPEQYVRMGIPEDRDYTLDYHKQLKKEIQESEAIPGMEHYTFELGAYNQLYTLLNTSPENRRETLLAEFKKGLTTENKVTKDYMMTFVDKLSISAEQKAMTTYFLDIAGRNK